MPSEGRGILSPVRLPVPPLQQVVGSLEFTRFPGGATQVDTPVIGDIISHAAIWLHALAFGA
jgi:hypothetical protein